MAVDIVKLLRILDAYLDAGELSVETHNRIRRWLMDSEFAQFQEQVADLIRPKELADAFFQIIPFGTGGRRGPVGVGTNRINLRTIGESAQGLADYIRDQDSVKRELAQAGVVVAYDTRTTSEEFARITVEVLAASGIKTYLFDGPRPTPELSFAVRHLSCTAGVVITASHNPPSDNGFKAYWADGGQVTPPHDEGILNKVRKVDRVYKIPLVEAKKRNLVKIIGAKIDDVYLQMLKKETVLCRERDAIITFSPLHGTGVAIIPTILKSMGFKKLFMPAAQLTMDGRFPTVMNHYPNPEVPEAMDMVVNLARQMKADVAMASDPDADRLGIFAPDKKGNFRYLTGNEVGTLMTWFVLDRLAKQRKLSQRSFVLTTLVSTHMIRKICEDYKIQVVDDLLVGFKYMAEQLHAREKAGEDLSDFVLGFEESIGYLRTRYVRDKDAAIAAVTIAQMTAHLKSKNLTLLDQLDNLYVKFGYHEDIQYNVYLSGVKGFIKMQRLMKALRTTPPEKIAGLKVHAIIDRLAGIHFERKSGKKSPVKGTKGDVLVFWLDAKGSIVLTIRPSGTEPKIKHYISVSAPVEKGKKLDAIKAKCRALANRIAESFKEIEGKIIEMG